MSKSQQKLEQLLKDFGAAFNEHDSAKLITMMNEDAVFNTVVGDNVNGNSIVGAGAIQKAFDGVWDLMPDANWEAGNIFVSGDFGLSEWIFTGTNKNDGSKIEAQGCDVFTFKNGKIAIKNAYRKQRPLL